MSQEKEHLFHEILVMETIFLLVCKSWQLILIPILLLTYLVHLLKQWEYKVTGTTKADEALALLRDKKNKFDIVITYVVISDDIPGFNLLEIISLEMDIPVILLYLKDDYESLIKGIKYGARDYICKPPRIEEMKKIWLHVYGKKLEHQGNQQKNCSDSTEEQSMEQKELSLKRNRESGKDVRNDTDIDGNPSRHKRERLSWEPELHQKFIDAVVHLGIENAVPSKILNLMNVPGLTREKVGSHLQKFRQSLKKETAKRNGTSCSSNTSMDTRPNNQTDRQPYPHCSSHVINQMPHHVQNQRQETPPSKPQLQQLFGQNPSLEGFQQQHVPPVVFPPIVLCNNSGGCTLPLYSAATTYTSPVLNFCPILFGSSSRPMTNLPQEPFVTSPLEIQLPTGPTEVTNSANYVHGGSGHSNRSHWVIDPVNNVRDPGVALRRGNDTSLGNHLERVASTGEDEIITLVKQFHDYQPPPLL